MVLIPVTARPQCVEIDDTVPVQLVDGLASYSDPDTGIHYMCYYREAEDGSRVHVATIALPIASHRASLARAIMRYSIHSDAPDTDWDDEAAPN